MTAGKRSRRAEAYAVLLVILLISFSNNASAGIGLSPGSVRFEAVLREGYSEKTVLLSTSDTEPVNLMVSASGPAKEWFNYSTEKRFVLSPRTNQPLSISVQPPADTPNGVYEGYITIVKMPSGSLDQGFGSAIAYGVSLKYYVEVSDVETMQYKVSGTTARDTEEKTPIEFSTIAENTGNVVVNPRIHIDILSEDKASVLKSVDYSNTAVLPTTRREILIKVPNDLPIGKYNSKFSAYLGDQLIVEEYLPFEVLEKGALKIQGRLEQVSLNKIWVYKGEIVEIKASFQNDGVLSTPATFKGKATIDDEVVGLLESDEIDVPAGERANLTTYFTPKRTGRYVISGKVYFSKKITAERSTILNVIEPESAPAAGLGETQQPGMDLVPVAAVALVASIVIGILIWNRRRSSGKAEKKR